MDSISNARLQTSWALALCLVCSTLIDIHGQPNWQQIKANADFFVADTFNYEYPEILSINVGGWEDGLYVTRDGKHLFSTYLPVDALSWFGDFKPCIDFNPYYRGPLLDIDTVTNIFGCRNYMQSDIIKTSRADAISPFDPWRSSNLRRSFTFEGGACGVLSGPDTFDVFVFTRDTGFNRTDIMFMRNVPVNPDMSSAKPILSSPAQEDNPHIERLPNGDLLLFFDRDRYIYFSISKDNGNTWSTPTLVTNVLNDQAPYDVQPHLWYDGRDWWVYFCAENTKGFRSIYRSKQMIPDDWNSWGPKELVLAANGIKGGFGNVIGVGEPTLTANGDLYFVTVYGNTLQPDTTDVFDCDPWVMRRKNPPTHDITESNEKLEAVRVYPNPVNDILHLVNIPAGSKILVYNTMGQNVMSKDWMEGGMVDVSGLENGLYILHVLHRKNFFAKMFLVKR